MKCIAIETSRAIKFENHNESFLPKKKHSERQIVFIEHVQCTFSLRCPLFNIVEFNFFKI